MSGAANWVFTTAHPPAQRQTKKQKNEDLWPGAFMVSPHKSKPLFLHYIIITTACHPSNTTDNTGSGVFTLYPTLSEAETTCQATATAATNPPAAVSRGPPAPGENQEADCGKKKNALHSLKLGMPCCQNAQNKKKHPSVGYPCFTGSQ